MVFSYICLVLYETNLEHCELLMHQAAAAAVNSKNQHPYPKRITTRRGWGLKVLETKEGPKKVYDGVVVVAVIGQLGVGAPTPPTDGLTTPHQFGLYECVIVSTFTTSRHRKVSNYLHHNNHWAAWRTRGGGAITVTFCGRPAHFSIQSPPAFI